MLNMDAAGFFKMFVCITKLQIHIPPAKLVYVVALLVKALCYKLEGCGFISRWGHWDLSLT
jgi:hypothetical protein